MTFVALQDIFYCFSINTTELQCIRLCCKYCTGRGKIHIRKVVEWLYWNLCFTRRDVYKGCIQYSRSRSHFGNLPLKCSKKKKRSTREEKERERKRERDCGEQSRCTESRRKRTEIESSWRETKSTLMCWWGMRGVQDDSCRLWQSAGKHPEGV